MPNLAQITVLIVDDQNAARSLLKKILTDMCVGQVLEAVNGRDALSLVESVPNMVDLIICDWNMPEMTGLEFITKMRAAGMTIPAIMTTGRADRESVLTARDAGVSSYLAKPFSLTQLEAKIRVALARKAAE